MKQAIVWCIIFGVFLGYGVAESPTDADLQVLRAARSVRLILNQSYKNAPDARLPIEEETRKLFKLAGITLTGGATGAEDVAFAIIVEGSPLTEQYSVIPTGFGGSTRYSGARLDIQMVFSIGDRQVLLKKFKGRRDTPSSISLDSYKTPNDAPFGQALQNADFKGNLLELIARVWGKNVLLAGLKDADTSIRRACAIELANHGDDAVVNALLDVLQKDGAIGEEAATSLEKIKDPQSVPVLLTLCKDKKENTRRLAAGILGEIGDPAAGDSLLRLLKDKSPAVREAAVCSLGKLRDPLHAGKCISMLQDPAANVRRAAAESLGGFGETSAVEPLLGILEDKDANIRLAALSSLQMLPDVRSVKALLSLLEDNNTKIQEAATAALAEIRDPAAVPEMRKHLQHEKSGVRKNVLIALAGIRDPSVIPCLVEAVRDIDQDIRKLALERLQAIDDPQAAEGLLAALDDPDEKVQAAIMGQLARIKYPAAVEPICGKLNDKSVTVRLAAIQALGELGDRRATAALAACLENSNREIRINTVKALGKLGDPASVGPLLAVVKTDKQARKEVAESLAAIQEPVSLDRLSSALSDTNDLVRMLAVELAGRQKAPEMVAVLISALQDPAHEVKSNAIVALRDYHDARAVVPLLYVMSMSRLRPAAEITLKAHLDATAVPHLISALKDEKSEIRQRAAHYLGQLKSTEAVDALSFTLRDPVISVRQEAATALGNIGDKTAVEPLIRTLKDKERSVRKAVVAALGDIGDIRAVEPLINVLKEKNTSITVAAADALRKITAMTFGTDRSQWKAWWKKNKKQLLAAR